MLGLRVVFLKKSHWSVTLVSRGNQLSPDLFRVCFTSPLARALARTSITVEHSKSLHLNDFSSVVCFRPGFFPVSLRFLLSLGRSRSNASDRLARANLDDVVLVVASVHQKQSQPHLKQPWIMPRRKKLDKVAGRTGTRGNRQPPKPAA